MTQLMLETGKIFKVAISILQTIWDESIEAELEGDISRALDVHEQILAVVENSYEAYLRAGWLHYQAGGYRKSCDYYNKAFRCSSGATAPLFGALDCYVAMGDSFHAAELVEKILNVETGGGRVRNHQEIMMAGSGAA